MIGFRLLLIAVALAAVAYVWNTSSCVPVVITIEPVYDYIIGNGLEYFPLFGIFSISCFLSVVRNVTCYIQ